MPVARVFGHRVLSAVHRVNAEGGPRLEAKLKEAIGEVLAPSEDSLMADPVDASSGAVDVTEALAVHCWREGREGGKEREETPPQG